MCIYICTYIFCGAIGEAGVRPPVEGLVLGEFAGALALEEDEGLGQCIVVVRTGRNCGISYGVNDKNCDEYDLFYCHFISFILLLGWI